MTKLFIVAPFIGRNTHLAYSRVRDIQAIDPLSEAYVVEDPTGMFAVVVGSQKDAMISKEIMSHKIALARLLH